MAGKSGSEIDLTVDAAPERALFVDMLTRDIELIHAIMDLIDNSVDGARAYEDDPPARGFVVSLRLTNDDFEIKDNCGGIELDVARQYAFRFGRPEAYKGTARSVGQFGVGMKRALFKLGHAFSIESRAQHTRFEMDVDVDAWVKDPAPRWTFNMSLADATYDPHRRGAGRGTTITVSRLREAVREDLADKRFLSLLREQIRYRHQAALAEGIGIRLNGESLTGLQTEILVGPGFEPINRAFVVASDHGDVSVRIIAGITDVERIGRDDGDAENFRGGSDAGWWIFCNDRLLMMREKTRLTGWGDSLPNYHPQYREFRGYCYMTAAETAALPWNTTKTGLDEESRVWRQVQAQIKIAASEVVSVLNRIKRESETAVDDEDMPTVLAMQAASLVPTRDLPERDNFTAPAMRVATRRPAKRKPKTQRLQYDVPKERFEAVAEKLRTDVVAEIGRRTFDYYCDREIDE